MSTTTNAARAEAAELWARVYMAALADYARAWESWRACVRDHLTEQAERFTRQMAQDRRRIDRAEQAIEDAGGTIDPWSAEGGGRIYDVTRRTVATF